VPACEGKERPVQLAAERSGRRARSRSQFPTGYGDVDALVRYLLALRSDPDLRRRLGERGRELARSRFSAAAFRERWRRLVLEELAGLRPENLQPLVAAIGRTDGAKEKA
jgi:hypothetical protein